MGGVLDGVRVIELTTMITGPLAGMLLADLGASIIKIENPEGGDPFRYFRGGNYSGHFIAYNRNKRSLTLDLRSARSKVEGRDLIAVFGMEGPNLALLDAHVAALNGETAEFTLEGARATVRCRVAPTHDAVDRVIGTFCLATKVERVDLREVPEPAAVA